MWWWHYLHIGVSVWPMMPRYGMDTARTRQGHGDDTNITHQKWSMEKMIRHKILILFYFLHGNTTQNVAHFTVSVRHRALQILVFHLSNLYLLCFFSYISQSNSCFREWWDSQVVRASHLTCLPRMDPSAIRLPHNSLVSCNSPIQLVGLHHFQW